MNKLGKIIVLVFLMMFVSVSFLAPVEGELTSSDFSGLSYSDKKGDDYTYRWEGDVSGFELDYDKSWGKKGKDPSFDIVSLQATLNDNIVTVTMECAGNIDLDYGNVYLVFFVKSNHDPSSCSEFNTILNPKDYKSSSINYDYGDYDNSHLYIGYNGASDDSYPDCSSYGVYSLDGSVSGKTMTLTVSAEDLEDEGISSGSGFGLYGFANKLESGMDYYTYTWDSIGVGAVSAPSNFESDSSGDAAVFGAICGVFIVIGIVILVVIILVILHFTKKKKAQAPQAPAQQQYPPQQPQQRASSAARGSKQYPCSYCRQPMTFNEQYQQWYCDYCQRYA